MTKQEFDEMAALVVRLRTDLELHTDALVKSNAQCAEYLRQNEQLRAELATARVSAASLERIQATAAKWGASGQEDAGHFIERTATDLEFMRLAKDEMQNKLAETTKDLAYSRLAVDTMCARDKRFKETGARCGAKDGEDIGDFIERSYADRNKMHSQLVEVRAALASVSEERDSLRRTLQEWEEEETKPHVRVTADDVADHVVPPVLPLCNVCHECGSELANCSQGTNHHDCPRPLCPRTCTGRHGGGFSPYSGPCKSATPVRHE